MQFLPSLAPIAPRFDGILLDLWGCLHDGTHLYPGARECLIELRKRNKKILMLSNAPRRAAVVVGVLDALGVDRAFYDGVMTSGEAGFCLLQENAKGQMPKVNNLPFEFCHLTSYFYIGPAKDEAVLQGLPHTATPNLAEAEFLLNVGFGDHGEGMDMWNGVLAAARAKNLPMLCLNPDMEVVKLTGERLACAGAIALAYEKLGGRVSYVGKPYPEIYAMALAMLGLPKDRVLAIGDSLHTDVLGAKNAGLASALVTGGVLKQQLGNAGEAELRAHLQAEDVQPDYVLPGLVW